jgi:hypothetical protein
MIDDRLITKILDRYISIFKPFKIFWVNAPLDSTNEILFIQST